MFEGNSNHMPTVIVYDNNCGGARVLDIALYKETVIVRTAPSVLSKRFLNFLDFIEIGQDPLSFNILLKSVEYFIWGAANYYMAAATELSGGRHIQYLSLSNKILV